MKNIKSYGYINYGPIPRNEYNASNWEISEDNTIDNVDDPTPEEMTYSRHLKKRQSMHPSGRRKVSGWSRSRKVNGWRAESAALHDEISDMTRNPDFIAIPEEMIANWNKALSEKHD